MGNAEYLWRALHPDHEDRSRPKDEVLWALKATSRALKYMRLTILDANNTRVLFLARVFEKGKDRSFIELSSFARDDVGWRYLAGQSRDAGDVADPTTLTIASFR